MPPADPRVPVDVIRREAQLACEAASLRSVATDVGLTPMGLRGFLRAENAPRKSTLRKLTQWYARHAATRASAGEAEARAALTVLLGLYPPDDRPRVAARFLGLMAAEFREGGMEPPPWFPSLRAEIRADGVRWPPGVERGPGIR